MDSAWDNLLSSCLTEAQITVLSTSPWEQITGLSYLCLSPRSFLSLQSFCIRTVASGGRDNAAHGLRESVSSCRVISCPVAQRWKIVVPARAFHHKTNQTTVWGVLEELAVTTYWLVVIDCSVVPSWTQSACTHTNMQTQTHRDIHTLQNKHSPQLVGGKNHFQL